MTVDLIGETDARTYFSFQRRVNDPNTIDVYTSNTRLTNGDALEYIVSNTLFWLSLSVATTNK